MEFTKHIRLPVTDAEHAKVLRQAGDATLTNYLRSLLGLEPRTAGRPAKPQRRKAAK